MSIPPLVCSTPPPPDQCEEYKDPDDYDLQYNLSQDDDDGSEYGFGNFSTYTNYESQTSHKQSEMINTCSHLEEHKVEQNENTFENNTDKTITETNYNCEEKLKCDEDINIEDLNLKVDNETIQIGFKNIPVNEKSCDSDSNHYFLKENSVDISNVVIKEYYDEIACVSNNSCKENTIEYKQAILESNFVINEAVNTHPVDTETDKHYNPLNVIEIPNDPSKFDNTQKTIEISTDSKDFNNSQKNIENMTDFNKLNNPLKTINIPTDSDELDNTLKTIEIPNDSDETDTPPKAIELPVDNDFDDFDDFQFIRSVAKSTDVIETCENPWQNEVVDSTDFGDFTAKFEDNENKACVLPYENVEMITKNESDYQHHICSSENDFDEFKSSDIKTQTKVTVEESKVANSVHIINLQSTDCEPFIMENINKLLINVFVEELTDIEDENDVKLETFLNETWGFLIETDIRQPYIVNWNNSFGQKTLLRALCIDSRNILFGPKWGYNMPKYAANLGAAPLQPQKQTSTSNNNVTAPNEAINVEKSVSKTGTWTDPFTTDGQESCNTEGDRNDNEPRPTDLDVFEATTTYKPEKIYPTSIEIQPIRQINLPETHIFTPTDSETPRSKTVHYDCVPSGHLSEQVSENHVAQIAKISFESDKIEDKTKEDEDWEFQGFNCTSTENCITPTTSYETVHSIGKRNNNPALLTPIPNTTYQINVLQPIKLEPVIPKLNWPDPGEVKHDFDDFTHFMSNSAWSENTLNVVQTDVNTKTPITDPNIEKDEISIESTNENISLDDDFSTFQFALPLRKQFNEFVLKSSSTDNTNLTNEKLNKQVISTSESKIEQVFENENIVKSDPISFTNVTKLNEPFITNLVLTTNMTDSICENKKTSEPSNSKILQPTPAKLSISLLPNQQKSGQILQPLTLESYSQINWPGPGIDLQDLSRFNPVDTLQTLKSDLTSNGQIKTSPIHNNKNTMNSQQPDEDIWGEFVSSKPKLQPSQQKRNQIYNDDEEWTDFVSSSSIKPQNGLNTISLNVHTNSNIQKTSNQGKFNKINDQIPLDIPSLNYITPKANSHKTYNERHFQNL